MERPDVDKITGLSPVISIEQKSTNRNPRSTVGTITEIYDFLRLLYARAGIAYSYVTGEQMVRYTDDQIIKMIQEGYKDKKIMLLSPVVRGRKGHYRELFEQIRKRGFIYVRIDGVITEVKYGLKVDRYKVHNIEIVIGDIRNKERMQNVFNTFQPQIVYHAAAYKHVPMMENNPSEALLTNVEGSRIIADLAVSTSAPNPEPQFLTLVQRCWFSTGISS